MTSVSLGEPATWSRARVVFASVRREDESSEAMQG